MTSIQSSNANASEPVFMLDFTASWCGPCRSIAPVLDAIASAPTMPNQRSLYLFKIDVDEPENEDLTSMFKVRSMPTIVWLSDGRTFNRIEGADKNRIIEITEQAKVPA